MVFHFHIYYCADDFVQRNSYSKALERKEKQIADRPQFRPLC